MSKKFLYISTTKLTAACCGLLLVVFCTIGMSFRPVYDEDEKELVMSGPKRNHWTWVDSGCAGDTYYYQSSVDYAKTQVQTRGNGSVTLSTSETTNVTSPVSGDPRTVSTTTATGNTVSISWNSGLSETQTESKPTFTETQITAAHKKTFTITATPKNDDYYFAGWGTSTSESSINNNDNPRTITSDMGITGYTESSSEPANYKNSGSPYTETYYAFFKQRQPVDITLKVPTNGTVSYSYESVPTTTLASETTITTKYDLTLSAAPAEGYVFFGWYTMSGSTENYISYANPNTSTYKENTTIYAKFIPAEQAIFSIKGTEQYYYDLNRACTEAASSSSKIVYLAKDGMMPAGNYTIPSGVNLLIPYNLANAYQTLPTVVTTAETLTAYRKLTLTDGVNIIVNNGAQICVGGQIMSAGGGKPSAYPTGACGVIDMSRGGHIELNNGATLYAWGFIKGQDMDQGNNTQNVGSITANSGAVVWEDFAVGDWRGGSACLTIYSNRDSWKFFPFQSYTIQNIEVPTTYKYGSTLSNYTNVYGDGHVNAGQFSIIGNSNTLFLLKDAASLVRKWYDPTTDLVCYEMSGTTQLDALNVDVEIITVSSTDFNLPLSSSMHIILTNCNTTISRPMVVQAGAVVEVKADATLTLSSNVYVFDKDQWGQYCRNKYFYSMANLSIHKDRGAGTSNVGLDDAKLFVNGGTVNITGKLYTTTSGADIMGSDGGKITFSSLPSAGNIVMCTGVSDNENVAVASANLHNEDDSYTKSIASTTFHNVNGRWFAASAKDEKPNHTYDFTYISSGAVSGTGGTNTTTDAVYSWDKTGLELQQKWANVTHVEDPECPWWHGQGEQSTWFYNWTLNSAWHQFIPTVTDGLYSASTNKLYTKADCVWEEFGDADVNCLYQIGGVKKALVDGQFVALDPNNNDPAYHEAEDPTKYYICFAGCNWHAADKYTAAEKAYIIEPDTFIWYNNAWMSVNFQEPFAYTIDETNVPVYYEYTDGEWVLAEPYVRVVDGLEDRPYWFLADAFKFASSVLRTAPTITILRDISGITTAVSYTGANKTCTLNLNGHTISGSVTKMLNIDAAGCTFTITDSTELKQGKISMSGCENARIYAVFVTNGTLILESGTIFGENTQEYVKNVTASTSVSAVYVAAGKTFTMKNGMVHAKGCYAAYGVHVAGSTSANATVNINGGTITAETTQVTAAYGIYTVGGTTYVKPGVTINATSKTTTAYGIYVDASTKKYYGTLNMTGGTVNVTNLTSGPAGGVFVQGVHIMSNVGNTTPNTIASSYLGVANISGGTFNIKNSSKTTGYGIYSLGNSTVSGSPVFNVTTTTTTAYGLFVQDGSATVSGTPTFNIKGTEIAYGIYANGATPANKSGRPYNPQVTVNGGTFNVQTTSKTTAYGIFVDGNTRNMTSTASGYYQGNYASAGNVTVNGGTFNVTAKTTKSYGVVVAAPKEEAGATEYDPVTANPKATINGGYFKMTGTGDVNAVNDLSTTDNLKVNGGYYSHDGNLATYTPSPKHVLTLVAGDANRPPYYYKVAEAYLVTFKSEDGTANIIDPVYQEVGTKPVCSTEPTKASTTTNSFTFDGWATSAGGAKVYEKNALPNITGNVTYYAHFATTTLKYRVHFDVATNDGVCDTENIYVEPGETIGTLPTATKYGYTFSGWFTAATGGTQLTSTTVINADAEYFAQFTVNTYTLTWVLDGGTVTTAGTAAAKNATGSPSGEVTYDAAITVPVVAKIGYVFVSWTPNPATKMPAEAATYTAIWTPKTNTDYTVKHYQQNVDGTYPATPTETEPLKGTTATSVTPAVKSYDGFVSPTAQTVTIAADGSTVVEYQYARRHYTFTLDAYTNGGTSEVPSIEVIHGATIGAVPPDAQKGCNDFTGWYTKAVGGVKITPEFAIEYDMKTLYAQFSDDLRTYPIIYNAGANGTGTVDAGTKTCGEDATLSSSTFTRTGYTQTGWSTTDGGSKTYDLGGSYTANAAVTLYPFWTINTYTITWKDGSTTIETDEGVTYGATPTFNGASPTKETDASYSYTFDGWDDGTNVYAADALPTVSGPVTYTAHYSTTPTVASVKVGSTTTYYTTIDAAFAHVNLQTANTELKLLRNTTAAASLVFTPAAAITCTFDLNNCTLSGEFGRLIDVKLAKSTFVITDNSVAKGGKVDNNYNANERVYGVVLTAGTFKLLNGAIYSTNPHTYSSAAANKSSAATAVYVAKGQTFTMENGTVESASQYASYAIYMARGTSTVTIKNGLVKGRTTKSTTAAGIYNLGKGLTVNGGRIIGHAYTTTAYGIYLYGGSGTINGGTIEATNDTTSNKGSTTTYGIYVNYYNGTYKGVLTIPSTSTVNVVAKARTTTSYAIVVGGGSTGSTIAGGTFTAKTKTGKTAYCVNSSGNITISGGTFTAYAATTNAYGLYSARGTITVNGDPTFNVTAGSTTAYGALAYGTIGKKGTGKYSGTIEINGGTFNVTSTAETAWGAYAGLASRDLRSCSATNDTVPGLHYMPGIISITDGTFNVKATTTGAYGVVVAKAKSESGTVGTTARIPLGTVTGGKFKVESMGDANATAYAMNSATTAERLVVQGGYYNTKRTDASGTSNIEDKYTAPTKSCNYRVLNLPDSELPYKYKVAEAYNLTWDAAGGELSGSYTSGYTAVGDAITAPTVTKTDYTFNGWTPDVAATMPAANTAYTATWELAETGFYVDIVDVDNSAKTLTLNTTGWASSGWPYDVNDDTYEKGDREEDRTLIIPYTGEAGEDFSITVKNKSSEVVSLHTYIIPTEIKTNANLDEQQYLYVKSGATLTVNANKTVSNIYVAPGAKLVINSGITLTADTVFLRTTPWESAELELDGTITGQVCYTRIIKKKDQYYQFGLPMPCPIADVRLSDGSTPVYGNGWLLRSYSEYSRAMSGTSADNWVTLTNADEASNTIQGRVGYEMFSNSGYYREYYFPVAHTGLANSINVTRTTEGTEGEPTAGQTHEGWNIVVSPLMRTYTQSPAPEGVTLSWLQEDGSYWQLPVEEIKPAIPFSYQATETGSIVFNTNIVLPAPRRRLAAEEHTQIQWLQLDMESADGKADQTSIYAHPTRYEQTYQIGIDVAKQSFTASRPLLYSSYAYGEMAFAGVADSLLEQGVALTVFSPKPQELTISLRDNQWLDRLAEVWLIDAETGAQIDLFDSDYTFEANEGTTRGRLVLMGRFKAPSIATDIDHTEATEGNNVKAQKLIIRDKLYIRINGQLYDATGKWVNDK